MSTGTWPLLLAGLGALGYGTASVLQAAGAREVHEEHEVNGHGPVATLLAPLYLIGTGLDLLAWLASLAALRSLPVFEVQAVLAGSLAVTAVLARLTLGTGLGRAGWLGIVAATASIAVLAGAAGRQSGSRLGGGEAGMLAAAAVPVAVAGVLAARTGRRLLCGALAGLAFGGAALCARAVRLPAWTTLRPHPAGLGQLGAQLATQPPGLGLAGFGVTGMLLYAHALEGGDAARVTALLWITEVAVPSAAGVLLLGDRVRAGWLPAACGAIVVCLVASWLLAADEPDNPDHPDRPGDGDRRGVSPAPPAGVGSG